MSKHTPGPTVAIPDDWKPTAGTIRSLPRPLRKYIHDLETDCDPAGTIRSEVLLREHTVPALTARVAELEAELAAVSKIDGKHTPGPWFVVNVGDEDEPMYTVKAARIAGKEPRHEVALCATGDSPQEMETANAHLIAAAPEMLEALKRARAWIELEMSGTVADCSLITEIDFAISKAGGRK